MRCGLADGAERVGGAALALPRPSRERDEESGARMAPRDKATETPLLRRDFTLHVALQPSRNTQADVPWRLLRVSGRISLDELAQEVLAPAMGWCGAHLYRFESVEGVRTRAGITPQP